MTMSLEILSKRVNARCRILLVDDDSQLLELNAVALIRFGYDVDTAKDGAAAWQALHDFKVSYNLLITDNKMPKITGLELIRKMRSEEMTLPVILVSGTIPTEELKQYPWLLLDATLSKPFTTAELLDTVKKVLRIAESPIRSSQLQFRDYAMVDNHISQAKKPAHASIQKNINPPHRILVVDDNSDTRQLSVDVLLSSGYGVDGVKDGAAGWEALRAGDHYDLVVTDNKMPNMTGIEMIAKLRSARITIPIIMATEHLPTHEFAREPSLKPDATLQRPFSNDDLLEVVKKILHTNDGPKPFHPSL
jgi:DNA-binding response OmpR family regulator